ncbi:MAG TPA: hypothetical protein VG389_29110, partial [Myxococcota bacterium]|nr:hypothetical protein [Myxococcota bacterium]
MTGGPARSRRQRRASAAPGALVATLAAALLAPAAARAGGGPMNVLLVFNADDAEAAAVATHYQSARSLPADHLCGLAGIDPLQRAMTFSEYETLVHDPFRACLTALPYPDDVDYVVLVRGLPYRVDLDAGGYSASLEALLQIHDTARTSDGAA